MPLIDAQCLFGAQWLLSLLEHSVGPGTAVTRHRGQILQALWVIQSSHGNVGTGLSHALAHQLGAAYGLDHGCGSAICLPATLRLLDASGRLDAGRLDLLAQAVGADPGRGVVSRVLQRMAALREQLGLPASLEEAGIGPIDLERTAAAVLADPTTKSSPGHALTAPEVLDLLTSIQTRERARQ
jgi:alcohol dehydrogenase